MHIKISYTPAAAKQDIKCKIRAITNLGLLITNLPEAERELLLNLGTDFKFTNSSPCEANTDQETGLIKLSLQGFGNFTYRSKNPTSCQLASYDSLREEFLRLVDILLVFSEQPKWKKTAFDEIDHFTPTAIELMAKHRSQHSHEKFEKMDIKSYVRNEQYGELLVEILLIKDTLKKSSPAEHVEEMMRAAFPKTYDMAMEFERQIEIESQKRPAETPEESIISDGTHTAKIAVPSGTVWRKTIQKTPGPFVIKAVPSPSTKGI